LILVLSVVVAYTLNIGHRLFPRDATEDLPPRRTPFPVSTRRRHFVPALPGFLWAGPAFGCGSLVRRKPSQPCPSQLCPEPTFPRAMSGGPFGRHPHATSATRIHARAARGAEQSRKPLFGEPGGLRYPRAELAEAKTSRWRASRLSTKFWINY